MIAGLEDISSGKLYIDNKEVSRLHPKHREIAMVFQNYALYPHMTVYDNMAFGLKIKRIDKNEIKVRVLAAAKILELDELLKKRPREMSGGQRQRVAIGRAIVRHPKVFLFDEPLSNLDAKLRGQMRAEIAKLHKSLKTTIIYVTHDQVEAMTLGDRIAVLNKGKLEQFDTPMNLYKHPKNKFVAGFIGTPPMNFVNGKLVKEGKYMVFIDEQNKLKFNTAFKVESKENKEVILGFRPEDVGVDKFSKIGHFSAKIDGLELLGAEQYLTVIGLKNPVICKISTNRVYQLNDLIDLNINLNKIYFFDAFSGMCIN